MPKLIFVYNADSGLFNTLADIGHKLFSPQTYRCNLCMLTHGVLKEREAWRRFVEDLPVECEFLHRDQFAERHPEMQIALPAVLVSGERLIRCIDVDTLARCRDLAELTDLVRSRCLGTMGPSPSGTGDGSEKE